MSRRSVVLVTGDRRRHRFAASRLAGTLDLAGVVVEKKAPVVEDESSLPPEDRRVIERHFAGRDEVEERILGEASFPDADRLEVERGGANAPGTFEWVREREPEMILLYGSSIIRPPLLDAYEGRMINLHLGLSPYYRGSGTNFWPLVNREPECVGATLHLAVAEVDAGPILGQVRPEPRISDRAHELGTRTLLAGLDAMAPVVDAFLSGGLEGRPQDLSAGRVYRNRDFDAEAVRTMWRNFEAGMMEEYLAEREARLRRVPIVEIPGAS